MAIKGESGILYLWDASAYKPIGCLTSVSLSTSLSIIESNTKCYAGVTKKYPGTTNSNISFEGEYTKTVGTGSDSAKKSHDALLLLQRTKAKVTIKLDTNVNDDDQNVYYADGYFSDLTADFGSGDELATFSGTFEIDGDILLTDPKD
jgi:hypothetical protein